MYSNQVGFTIIFIILFASCSEQEKNHEALDKTVSLSFIECSELYGEYSTMACVRQNRIDMILMLINNTDSILSINGTHKNNTCELNPLSPSIKLIQKGSDYSALIWSKENSEKGYNELRITNFLGNAQVPPSDTFLIELTDIAFSVGSSADSSYLLEKKQKLINTDLQLDIDNLIEGKPSLSFSVDI